jgi:tetratricopeptide (TPR) repeat protein
MDADETGEVLNLRLSADPRFIRGVALFNDGEYLEASDCFEELFFEGVRDEPDFLRIFLQFSVGIHHAQTGQWRPAVERIEEGLRLVSSNENNRGVDLAGLAAGMKNGVRSLREKRKPVWPKIVF